MHPLPLGAAHRPLDQHHQQKWELDLVVNLCLLSPIKKKKKKKKKKIAMMIKKTPTTYALSLQAMTAQAPRRTVFVIRLMTAGKSGQHVRERVCKGCI